eukprot:2449813-Rhodomonas_salina.1
MPTIEAPAPLIGEAQPVTLRIDENPSILQPFYLSLSQTPSSTQATVKPCTQVERPRTPSFQTDQCCFLTEI